VSVAEYKDCAVRASFFFFIHHTLQPWFDIFLSVSSQYVQSSPSPETKRAHRCSFYHVYSSDRQYQHPNSPFGGPIGSLNKRLLISPQSPNSSKNILKLTCLLFASVYGAKPMAFITRLGLSGCCKTCCNEKNVQKPVGCLSNIWTSTKIVTLAHAFPRDSWGGEKHVTKVFVIERNHKAGQCREINEKKSPNHRESLLAGLTWNKESLNMSGFEPE